MPQIISPMLVVAATSTAALIFSGTTAKAEDQLQAQAQEVFGALPQDMATAEFPVTPPMVELGRKLFFDPRISADGTVSCSRCHASALYGTDGLAKSRGVHDRANPRNAPTVLNAALEFKAHWRGERANVEDQATQALVGPTSFGNADYADAMAKLRAIPDYAPLFATSFAGAQDPITPENWGRAIGAYERTLVTPSAFDDYLGGKTEALSQGAREGLRLFMDTGCTACHNGPGIGGNMFQKFGVMEDYWKETGVAEPDKGRADITKDPADLYVFKVPSLRNVAMTAPYFHDGSVSRLGDAVRIMAKVQLDKQLTDPDIANIVAFLASLTGKLPDGFAQAPVLPAAAFASPPLAKPGDR